MKYLLLIFLLIFPLPEKSETNKIRYQPSDDIFSNPERGFSTQMGRNFNASSVYALDAENITVIQRIYLLEEFVDKPISEVYLQNIGNDLEIGRKAGKKFVLRFSYTSRQNGNDASLGMIEKHLDQLKSVMADNYDVIAYVEAGLIGAWGEWYYSSNNLNNTRDRRKVLFKLLSVVPKERMVVVRTPKYKMDIFNLKAGDWLPADSAFSGSYRARTGSHNDCFLAGADDMGTYSGGSLDEERKFLHMDNRFVPMGGETCRPFPPKSECPAALDEMKYIHFSILNRDYNRKVLDSWICMDDVKRRLGYCFRLVDAEIPLMAVAGHSIELKVNLVNDGFAGPFNARRCDFLLREKITGKTFRAPTGDDPRFWLPDSAVTLKISAGIPRNLPAGEYEALLHLGDPAPALTGRPEYSIRMANEDVWEEKTGFNSLRSTITIASKGRGRKYSGTKWLIQD